MRGLRQSDDIKEVPIALPETSLEPPEITFRDKVRFTMGNYKQRWTGRRIKSGKIPHGRTDAPIKVNTLLDIRHKRNGEEIGRHEVYNRVVTNAGRDAIVDAFTGGFNLSTFNYHDCGTGTTAESVSNTALITPVSEARVAGVQSQPTSDVYQSTGTITFTSSYAIVEHGLFSQSTKPGGVLLDRTVFPAINVLSGDKIEFSFTLTFTSGG